VAKGAPFHARVTVGARWQKSGTPLKAGLIESLARPGGNLTGVTLDPGIEICGKRLELLKKALASITSPAFLSMREGWRDRFGKPYRTSPARWGFR